jgi:effector-binding domain-containing protein
VAYEVQTKVIAPQLALTVRKRVTMTTISEALDQAFGAIMASAEASGARFVGPPFALYPAEVTVEFETVVCMPVAPGATASDAVVVEEIPGGAVATTLHKGAYSGLGAAYGAVQAWMVSHGKKPTGPCREVYLNEPGHVPDNELLTEIDWPFV